jgi:eukaryotic-like serine/threonine-protein kinase
MAGRDTASRELFLGLYALESDSIEESHLVMAAQAWARSPEKTRSEILAGDGRLDARTLARLQDRVRRELALTGGNPDPGYRAGTRDRSNRPSGIDPTVTADYPGSPLDEGADAYGGTTSEDSGTGIDGR